MATATWYGNGALHVGSGDVAYATDTIRAALLGSGYTIAKDTHEFFSDVSANEVSGTGYTAGGEALASKNIAYDATSDEVRLSAADTVWDATGGSLAANFAVVYKDTGTPSTSPLLGVVDFEGEVSATNDTFTVDWDDTRGVLVIDAT